MAFGNAIDIVFFGGIQISGNLDLKITQNVQKIFVTINL